MPYNDVLKYPKCHVVEKSDIEGNAFGVPQAKVFLREYRKSNRDFIKSLIVPFRPDPYGEGRPMNISPGNARRTESSNYHPRRGNAKVFAKFEKILGGLGLSVNCNTGKIQNVIVPSDSTPPLQRHFSTPIECEKTFGINTEEGMRTVPISVHEREVPDWTLSDEKVCAYLRHRCPAAFLNPVGPVRSEAIKRRSHRKLSELCAVIYLWFRCLLTAAQIAEDLGISVARVMMIAQDARQHYPKFEAGTCGCSRRSSRVRMRKAA